MTICSHCGQSIPHPGRDYPGFKDMTVTEKRLLDIVARAGENGIQLDLLLGRLYEGDINGGPLTRSYQVHISKINKKLVGWRVVCDNWGGPKNRGKGGIYRLVQT